MNLTNRTALVTGGSSGIGLAIARMLVDAGSKVAITGRNQARLTEAAKAVNAHPIKADVSSEDDVKRTYREFLDTFGHLDILVNNAAFGERRALVDIDRASFDAIKAIRLQESRARIVVLTMHNGEEYIHRALEAGAASYVLKDSLSDNLVGTIRDVYEGRHTLAPDVEARLAVLRMLGGQEPEIEDRLPRRHQTPSSSTSNSSVAFGGMTPPAPRAP